MQCKCGYEPSNEHEKLMLLKWDCAKTLTTPKENISFRLSTCSTEGGVWYPPDPIEDDYDAFKENFVKKYGDTKKK